MVFVQRWLKVTFTWMLSSFILLDNVVQATEWRSAANVLSSEGSLHAEQETLEKVVLQRIFDFQGSNCLDNDDHSLSSRVWSCINSFGALMYTWSADPALTSFQRRSATDGYLCKITIFTFMCVLTTVFCIQFLQSRSAVPVELSHGVKCVRVFLLEMCCLYFLFLGFLLEGLAWMQ